MLRDWTKAIEMTHVKVPINPNFFFLLRVIFVSLRAKWRKNSCFWLKPEFFTNF